MSTALRSRARGASKIVMFEILRTKWKSRFTVVLNTTKNTGYIKKMFQIKVVQNYIFYKNFTELICLFPSGMELEGSNDCRGWNIILYWNMKLDSLLGWWQSLESTSSTSGGDRHVRPISFL